MNKSEKMSDLYKNVCLGLITVLAGISTIFLSWLTYTANTNQRNIAVTLQIVQQNTKQLDRHESLIEDNQKKIIIINNREK